MNDGAFRARITGVGLWTRRYPTTLAWLSGEPSEPAEKLKAPLLDRQCARRASIFAKSMALAYEEATKQAEVSRSELATVFGSALGETQIMLKLLEQMITESDDFSPMLFAVSVHNAASGLVSISTKNRAFTTSLAADHDTPAMALMEAVGVSRIQNAPVVVVCGDEAAPEGLVPQQEVFSDLAVALVIDSRASEGHGLAYLQSMDMGEKGPTVSAELPDKLARNPQAGLLDLADAILREQEGWVRLDRGKGRGYRVRLGRGP